MTSLDHGTNSFLIKDSSGPYKMAQVPQITLKMLKGAKNKEFWPNRREEYQYGRKIGLVFLSLFIQ